MTAPLDLRRQWRQVRSTPPSLRIALLASYTIDPLVPYLGVHLHDAGLPAELVVGPFDQIAQQCVDDAGEVARARPDVLVVAPRWEEAGDELANLADLALTAARRRHQCLVFVLPAVPDTPMPDGRAVAARAVVRARLGGEPNVHIADTEAAVRSVGARRAYRPSLFRVAKIPYAEEVFAELGRQVAALLRVRYGVVCRGVVLDADRLLWDSAGHRPDADALRSPLRALADAGVRIAVRGSGDVSRTWPAVDAALGSVWPVVDDWVVDDRPLDDQLTELAVRWELPAGQLTLVTAAAVGTVPARVVELTDQADDWPAELVSHGVFDRAPVVVDDEPVTAPPTTGGGSLEAYIAGLDVRIDWRSATPADVAQVSDMLLRTKDFAAGIPLDEPTVAAGLRDMYLADVRDRLADHGTGVAIGMTYRDGVCVVDLFLVSCPVLGRGVEQATLDHIIARAAEHDCPTVEFRYQDTGRNQLLIDFVTAAAQRSTGILARPA